MENKYDAQFEETLLIDEIESFDGEFENKRKMLEKTKIVKQTWSITEIYQKIKSEDLILDPDYQRNEVWQKSKQVSFIESLFMEIMIPPIYVVEVPGLEILERKKYEVVDGKQRLTTIKNFINNDLQLDKKYLEYYSDIYDGKKFVDIFQDDEDKLNQVLSSILDIYVITSNSPAETKYDIFARLNKGAEPLKVNEIRKAIYHSAVTQIVDQFIKERIEDEGSLNREYLEMFSKNDIKRFNDYGRFYRSIAFCYCTDIYKEEVENYNSRPKQMIDNILQEFQNKARKVNFEEIKQILNYTMKLLNAFRESQYKDYLIDACIPFALLHFDKLNSPVTLEKIMSSQNMLETFEKSPATTSNVNRRVEIVSEILRECD